jgi:hypothetical protein
MPSSRSLPAVLAVLALAFPIGAKASIAPRVALAMVVEDGPPGSKATAVGPALSLGLALGAPWLSAVADLGFRGASVASSNLEGGWTEYATKDTVLTLGLHSEFTVLERWVAGGELHAGRVWPAYRASAGQEVYVGDGHVNVAYGGAAEASYLMTPQLSVGLRAGIDRFASIFWADTLDPGNELDARRTSVTIGLLTAYRL